MQHSSSSSESFDDEWPIYEESDNENEFLQDIQGEIVEESCFIDENVDVDKWVLVQFMT